MSAFELSFLLWFAGSLLDTPDSVKQGLSGLPPKPEEVFHYQILFKRRGLSDLLYPSSGQSKKECPTSSAQRHIGKETKRRAEVAQTCRLSSWKQEKDQNTYLSIVFFISSFLHADLPSVQKEMFSGAFQGPNLFDQYPRNLSSSSRGCNTLALASVNPGTSCRNTVCCFLCSLWSLCPQPVDSFAFWGGWSQSWGWITWEGQTSHAPRRNEQGKDDLS